MKYEMVAATLEDQSRLEQLRRTVYHELFFATWGRWDEVRHQRHFSDCWTRGGIFLIEVGGVRVGMIQLIEHPEEIEVGEIQIALPHQGNGVGSAVLRDTIASAWA